MNLQELTEKVNTLTKDANEQGLDPSKIEVLVDGREVPEIKNVFLGFYWEKAKCIID